MYDAELLRLEIGNACRHKNAAIPLSSYFFLIFSDISTSCAILNYLVINLQSIIQFISAEQPIEPICKYYLLFCRLLRLTKRKNEHEKIIMRDIIKSNKVMIIHHSRDSLNETEKVTNCKQ